MAVFNIYIRANSEHRESSILESLELVRTQQMILDPAMSIFSAGLRSFHKEMTWLLRTTGKSRCWEEGKWEDEWMVRRKEKSESKGRRWSLVEGELKVRRRLIPSLNILQTSLLSVSYSSELFRLVGSISLQHVASCLFNWNLFLLSSSCKGGRVRCKSFARWRKKGRIEDEWRGQATRAFYVLLLSTQYSSLFFSLSTKWDACSFSLTDVR